MPLFENDSSVPVYGDLSSNWKDNELAQTGGVAAWGEGWKYAPQPGGTDPHSLYFNHDRFNDWRNAIGQSQRDQDAAMQDWRNRFSNDYRTQMLGQAGQAATNMRSEAMAGGANMSALRGATSAGNEAISGTRMDAVNVGRSQEEQSRLAELLARKNSFNDIGNFWNSYAGNLNQQDQYARELAAMQAADKLAKEQLDKRNESATIAGIAGGIPLVGGIIGGVAGAATR